MIIHEGYENLNLIQPVVTIGVFDGVHLGHRALLEQLVNVAHRTGGESVVLTFNPHPRLVLGEKTDELCFLTTLEEKKKILAATLIDHLVIIEFNNYLSNMEAIDFIREILVRKIGIKHLVVGYDNHFGKNKKGDLEKISRYAGLFDFTVEQGRELSAPEGAISSTSIREALLMGHVEVANRWLGYYYSLTGIVIQGRKLGRSLGFPTANIKPDDNHKLIPANGVYAVDIMLDNKKLTGMLSIGFNPTVNKRKRLKSIEVHIFNFDSDLYGLSITLFLRFRLRDEKKFESIKELSKQMVLDKDNAMRLLS
jgi:riboflavin kinase / FMN adenylyltransferase